jgi:hypothetical protein
MFELASRKKLTFNVAKGVISVDDLWDLSLESLDDIAKKLHKEIKEADEVSFIKTSTNTNQLTELRFNIVKRVIEVKLEEAELRKDRKAKSERKAAILKILATKQDEALQAKSTDELLKELEDLD